MSTTHRGKPISDHALIEQAKHQCCMAPDNSAILLTCEGKKVPGLQSSTMGLPLEGCIEKWTPVTAWTAHGKSL